MAFSKDYTGDTKALAVIIQTIDKKNALIPGVTVKQELAGLVKANFAEFYYDLAPSVAEVTAGADFNTSQKGNAKATLALSKALHIDEKIPHVAIETIEAGVMYDTIMKGALALSNKVGEKFIDGLVALSQSETLVATEMYDGIVEAIGDFAGRSSVNVGGVADTTFSNKVNGIQSRTIMVGDVGRAKLYKSEAFQRTINATGAIQTIGEILGHKVVYSQDLTGHDFILLNPEGVAFPYSINTLRAVESENFNGVRVQGEVSYPAQAYGILPVDSFAVKYTLGA